MSDGSCQDGSVSGEHGTSWLVLLVGNWGPHLQAILGILLKMGHLASRVLSNEPVQHRLSFAVVQNEQVIAFTQQSLAVVAFVQYHFLRHQVPTVGTKLRLPEFVHHFANFVLNVSELKTCLAGLLNGWVQLL